MIKAGLVIPTWNAGAQFLRLLHQIDAVTDVFSHKLVIDSSSSDATAEAASEHGFDVIVIPKAQFSHGGTRQDAFQLLKGKADVIVYITQDVLLYDAHSFPLLLRAFRNKRVGAAYGRQLPRQGASAHEQIQQAFNYPDRSRTKTMEDAASLGIKTPFLSDAFAAYRCEALERIGGFPRHVRICEDVYAGGKLLLQGYEIAYVAEAKVFHSHDFSVKELWHRYAAIGRFYRHEHWLLETFGTTETEGIRFAAYQANTLLKNYMWAMAGKIVWMDALKYFAYHFGSRATDEKMAHPNR